MQRSKTMARAFASQFLAPLFLEVFRLVIENEDRQRIVDIAGSWVEINPSAWSTQRDVMIDFRLGYGERDQRAKEIVEIGTLIGQDQAVAHLFGPEKRYNLYKRYLETKGYRDVSSFLADPKTTEPPKPDPMVQLEIAERQSNIELNKRKQDLAEKKADFDARIEQMQADFDKRFATLEYVLKTHEMERKDAETANRIEVAEAEIELARKAQEAAPPENEKATAIISPNG